MGFDYSVQGLYKLVSLSTPGGQERMVLAFHTVEDGTQGGEYWILAEKNPLDGRWQDLSHLDAPPRIHPRKRGAVIAGETISRLDAEFLLLLAEKPDAE